MNIVLFLRVLLPLDCPNFHFSADPTISTSVANTLCIYASFRVQLFKINGMGFRKGLFTELFI